MTEAIYFCPMPYTDVLLRQLALETLALVIDSSGVGRGCVALMINVVYKGRALPRAWLVRQGKKGHFPEDLHIAVVAQVKKLVPQDAQVVLLGDGEFDGTTLQETLRDYHLLPFGWYIPLIIFMSSLNWLCRFYR